MIVLVYYLTKTLQRYDTFGEFRKCLPRFNMNLTQFLRLEPPCPFIFVQNLRFLSIFFLNFEKITTFALGFAKMQINT